MYITTVEELQAFVERVRKSPVVGIDTEFMRERTYFARLCLVQIASESEEAIVDPLAIGDIRALCPLLEDESVTKVLHAGGQDLEIFYRECGVAMTPVFDTQVAATLAGFPQQVGYGPLVHDMLGVRLDKGDTYTDWAKRPLSETQVEYALNDVRHLPALYRLLSERLEREGRTAWLAADFHRMADPSTYVVVPEEQWRRVKRISSLNRRQLAVAREVAAWRETEAMRRNVPKRWVLGDESIIEVARRMPKSTVELMGIRGVGDKVGKAAAQGLVEAVDRGRAVPDDVLPSLERRKRPAGDIDAAVDLMVAIVRKRARQHGVAMPLLASRDELERLAAGEREGNSLLAGWKAEMVGSELVDLLDGRLQLRLDGGELCVDRRE